MKWTLPFLHAENARETHGINYKMLECTPQPFLRGSTLEILLHPGKCTEKYLYPSEEIYSTWDENIAHIPHEVDAPVPPCGECTRDTWNQLHDVGMYSATISAWINSRDLAASRNVYRKIPILPNLLSNLSRIPEIPSFLDTTYQAFPSLRDPKPLEIGLGWRPKLGIGRYKPDPAHQPLCFFVLKIWLSSI